MQIEQESSTPAASPSSAGAASAPGVVATVVATQPAPFLDETLRSLAAQDYPNLQVVVLVTGSDESHLATTLDAVAAHVPTAHVRQLGGNPGFGPAANAVLRLVEGDSGFFLLMHDDVALDPGAVTAMVEEVYRSNAGVVGPKLVDWDDPRILQVVGYTADRFGVLDTDIEPGEIDQEQHDAVRDVFVLPSACLLVRADLFRTLGGFEPTIDFHGEDVDLCWRAHASGARGVVVPTARARHAGGLVDRRPDIGHAGRIEGHRATTVAVMTGGLRLPFVLVGMTLESLLATLFLVLRGRPGDARVRIGAIASMIANSGRIFVRRRRVSRHRLVPDHEVFELQSRGSVRWRRWLRGRRALAPSGATVPRTALLADDRRTAWGFLVLFALFVVGARDVIFGEVRHIGDFLPIDGPRTLFSDSLSGWWSQGLGASTPHPTAHLLLSLAGLVSFGHPGLLLTTITVGLIPIGWWGASRMCMRGSGSALRIVGPVVYAAVPLPYAAVATGRLPVLVGYAALPWVLHLVAGFAENADPDSPRSTDVGATRRRRLASLTLLMGVVIAFAPDAALVVVASVVMVTLASLIDPAPSRDGVAGLGALVVSFAGGVVLNLPWITRYLADDGWSALVGVDGVTREPMSLWSLASFDLAGVPLGGFILVLYIPVFVAPLVARGQRFTVSVRGALLVSSGLLIAVVAESGRFPFSPPDTGLLLVPVACGLALGAPLMLRVFTDDVRGGNFGWRQPLAILAVAAVPLGILPAGAVAVDGSYDQPSFTFNDQMAELLNDRTSGEFRVLVLGDPDLVPGAARPYSESTVYSIVNNARPGFGDVHRAPTDDERRLIRPVVEALAVRSTERVGRLSAPLGIRYFVVPLDGAVPEGLVDSLETQLDLRRVYSPASMAVFENTQFIPVTAMLSAIASASSTSGGESAIAQSDLTGSIGVLAGVGHSDGVSQVLPEGTLHLGVPLDPRWKVEFEGASVPSRASFGSVMAFQIPAEGRVTLAYAASAWRFPILALQILAWVGATAIVIRPHRRRRGRAVGGTGSEAGVAAETLVVLGGTGSGGRDQAADPVAGPT